MLLLLVFFFAGFGNRAYNSFQKNILGIQGQAREKGNTVVTAVFGALGFLGGGYAGYQVGFEFVNDSALMIDQKKVEAAPELAINFHENTNTIAAKKVSAVMDDKTLDFANYQIS